MRRCGVRSTSTTSYPRCPKEGCGDMARWVVGVATSRVRILRICAHMHYLGIPHITPIWGYLGCIALCIPTMWGCGVPRCTPYGAPAVGTNRGCAHPEIPRGDVLARVASLRSYPPEHHIRVLHMHPIGAHHPPLALYTEVYTEVVHPNGGVQSYQQRCPTTWMHSGE